MKKLIISALALTFLASPVLTASDASAQNRQDRGRQELREDRREDRREVRQDRRQANRPAWLRNGGRYSGGRNYVDHRRYGLRAPARGQRWVQYNDTYVLVTVASGLIGAIIASQ